MPPALGGIVRKLLAKKPEERYQTPAELLAALDVLKLNAATPGRPPMAQPLGPGQGSGRAPMAIPLSPLGGDTPSWRSWFSSKPPAKSLPLIIGGSAVILLGIIFMIVALMALKR